MEFNLNLGDKIQVLNGDRKGKTTIVLSKIKKVGRRINYSMYVETAIGRVSLNNLKKI